MFMRIFLLVANVCLFASSAASASGNEPCGKPDPVSMAECEIQGAEKSEKDLDETYENLRRALVPHKKVAAQLTVAQTAWSKHRHETCKLEGKAVSTTVGGYYYALVEKSCKSRMAKGRVKDLREFAKEYGF
jgi:uncharacterized protein YecT (DUF1311 family)